MDHHSSHHVNSGTEGKFILDAAELVDHGAPLPDTYGDNRLVLMVRDPSWIFAYWEVTSGRIQSIQDQFGEEIFTQARVILRAYALTPEGQQTAFTDMDIALDWRQTYIHYTHPERFCFTELGLLLKDGKFIAILRSNRVRLPRGRVSDRIDSEWMAVDIKEAEWLRLMEASGAGNIGRGSSEASRIMAQRWELLRAIFSGTSMWLSSSGRPWSGWLPSSTEKSKST